jgi:hypothetical protein
MSETATVVLSADSASAAPAIAPDWVQDMAYAINTELSVAHRAACKWRDFALAGKTNRDAPAIMVIELRETALKLCAFANRIEAAAKQ